MSSAYLFAAPRVGARGDPRRDGTVRAPPRPARPEGDRHVARAIRVGKTRSVRAEHPPERTRGAVRLRVPGEGAQDRPRPGAEDPLRAARQDGRCGRRGTPDLGRRDRPRPEGSLRRRAAPGDRPLGRREPSGSADRDRSGRRDRERGKEPGVGGGVACCAQRGRGACARAQKGRAVPTDDRGMLLGRGHRDSSRGRARCRRQRAEDDRAGARDRDSQRTGRCGAGRGSHRGAAPGRSPQGGARRGPRTRSRDGGDRRARSRHLAE